MRNNIRTSIISLYLIKFSMWFNLVMPVIVLFYQGNGQEGWITSAGNFAEAIAGVTGGLLATISLRMPFCFHFISFVGLPIPS